MSLVDLCEDGDLEGVKAALQRGADVNTKNEEGLTGLMWAVWKNHNSLVELLLKTPNIDVNQNDTLGWCALHWAEKAKNHEGLKLLLNVPNIDVNIVNILGGSALQLAVKSRNIALCSPPLQLGVEISLK